MFATLKIILIRLIALGSTVFATGMLYWGYPLLRSVFRLTDPTGSFGATFVLAGFAANLCTIFVFGVYVRHAMNSRSWRERTPIPFRIIFLLKAFEAINVLPCLADKPGALCGASAVFVSYVSSPVIVVAAAQIIFRNADVKIRYAGKVMLALVLIGCALGWKLVTPKSARECAVMHELTDRSVCAERFALDSADMSICRTIDFRSVRYDCMGKIAQMKRDPSLCDEIEPPPGARVTKFETPASVFRDVCYYGLAFNMRDHNLCEKVGDLNMRTTCNERTGASSRNSSATVPTGIEGWDDGTGLPPK